MYGADLGERDLMKLVNCQHWEDCGVAGGGCCAIAARCRPSYGVCRHCDRREPISGWQGLADDVAPSHPAPDAMRLLGPALWAKIHRWALALTDPINLSAEMEWLNNFAKLLPCGECKSVWLAMLDRTPPDLSSAAALFAWTVARHNEVNARLGKPSVSIGVAGRHWLEAAS